MREINFRVWDKDEKCWASFVDDTYDYVWALTLDGQFIYTSKDRIYPQEHWVMMQYTGLKDKNGVEIYESDIVKIELETDNYENAKIQFNVLDGMYEVEFIDSECTEHFNDWTTISHFKVIGNIYQNPELLK